MTDNPDRAHHGTATLPAAPFRFLWYTGEWPVTIRALRHRNFRYFWTGQLVSLIGTWLQSTAQSWLVLELATRECGAKNAAFYVGLVGALGSAPMFLLTLFAGVVADRLDRRRILIITQTILALLAASLAVLVGTGHIRLWHVVMFSMCSGLAMAFDMPTRQSFVKDMAAPEDLLNAIALNSSIFNLARILGPAVAGWLMSLTYIGIPGVLYLNAVSYLAVIAGLCAIRVTTASLRPSADSVWQGLREGFRYARENRPIRLLLQLMSIFSIFGFSYAVLLSVVASQVLGQKEQGYGYLLTAAGVGAFIGAVYLASSAHRVRKGRMLLMSSLIFTLALIGFSQVKLFDHLSFTRTQVHHITATASIPKTLGSTPRSSGVSTTTHTTETTRRSHGKQDQDKVPISPSFIVSLLLLPLVGGGLVIASASVNSLIQEIVPDQLRGRVVSIWAFIFAGFSPVGALFVGTVARYTSPLEAYLFGGAICLVTILLISFRAKWLWSLK